MYSKIIRTIKFGLINNKYSIKIYTICVIIWSILMLIAGVAAGIYSEGNIAVNIIGALFVALLFFILPFFIPLFYLERKAKKLSITESFEGNTQTKISDKKTFIPPQSIPYIIKEKPGISKKGNMFLAIIFIICLIVGIITVNISEKNEKEENQESELKNKPPTADFTYLPENPTIFDIVLFSDMSNDSDGKITNWSWKFGDEGISYQQNSSFKFNSVGTYNITLIVKDDDGAIDSKSTDIVIINQPKGNFTVYFIDVGQGDSILLGLPDSKYVLIDAGKNTYSNNVIETLNDLSITTLEALIITHPDEDHLGGADDVLENFEVLSVYHSGYEKDTKAYQNFINASEKEGVPIYSDDEIDIDEHLNFSDSVSFQVLHIDKNASDPNDSGIVLRVEFGKVSFLFTGDISSEVENDALKPGPASTVDFLKVAHHGSKYSTSNNFLDVITPSIGVISVGDNSYGHPSEETLNRLEEHGVMVYRTDYHGTITITSDGESWDISTEKIYEPSNNPPVASFTYNENELTVDFNDNSNDEDGDTLTCLWNFGDGDSSDLENPSHTYDEDGTYTVELTVNDGEEEDSISKDITVEENEPSGDHVVINEFEQNPSGTDSGNEWLELYNPTDNTVDVGGWKIKTTHGDTKSHTISNGKTISSGGYLVINFDKQFLDNEDETVILQDESNSEVDRTHLADDTNNNGDCWQRSPNGKDNNSDNDWSFKQSTKGGSN